MQKRCNSAPGRCSNRWAVILAGGDGTRLRSLTRKITGDDRPKQFCPITGDDTLLAQTRERVRTMIPSARTMILLTETHRRYFRDQLAGVPAHCQLVQPFNHGTAAAIAYSLTRLSLLDHGALVAFFPSDHHFANDRAFFEHVNCAFDEAATRRDRVILLGIEADTPEKSYGWIEPGARLGGSLSGVRRFWEKPSGRVARRLLRSGCLWNSFVMIGSVSAFLGLLERTAPDLLRLLGAMWESPAGTNEQVALAEVYRQVAPSNFSSEVLAACPADLAVLRARGLGWSDLGEPQRVFSLMDAERQAMEPLHPFPPGIALCQMPAESF
jgi:mannose-1-phosphate guanylyltransferase